MFERTLDCGVKLVGERRPAMRSATIGIWVAAGSITETRKENGISHFIEHMMFKGTTHRTAKQIAIDVDNIGGQMNAFTSKEATCYYIRVMDENLPDGIDILTDLFCNATLPADELEKERGVILEEIAMSNDIPEDVVMDLIAETFFGDSSLGKSILGPASNISHFTRDDLLDYIRRFYTASNIVVAIAGSFDEDRVADQLNEVMRGVNRTPLELPAFSNVSGFETEPGFGFTSRDIEQVHMCFGFPAVSQTDLRERYALNVLNNVVGGSMSSRLFQKIREDMGLAYSVFSQPMLYRGTGMFGVYAGTLAKNAPVVTSLILEELDTVRKNGITRTEFEQSKRMLKGNLVLQLENTGSQMNSLAKSWLFLHRLLSEEDILRLVDEVTYDEIAESIDKVTNPQRMSSAYVGSLEDPDAMRSLVEKSVC